MKKKRKSVIEIPKKIRIMAKVLSFLSKRQAANFAYHLFSTPVIYPRPKREEDCYLQAQKGFASLKNGKKIRTYQWGNGKKKILLVHGWNGRATQFYYLIKHLEKHDYTIISFDAPGHGDSPKNKTVMLEFMEATHQLQKIYGDWHAVIGHSLGGMATINAIPQGLKTSYAITIGASDIIEHIFDGFAKKLQFKKAIKQIMIADFEKRLQTKIEKYNVSEQAKKIEIPVLIIHDKNDREVPFKNAENIYKSLKKGTLFVTERLGHNRILSNEKMAHTVIDFIK